MIHNRTRGQRTAAARWMMILYSLLLPLLAGALARSVVPERASAAPAPDHVLVVLSDRAADALRYHSVLPRCVEKLGPLPVDIEPVFYDPKDPEREGIFRELGMHRWFRIGGGATAGELRAKLRLDDELWAVKIPQRYDADVVEPNDLSIYWMWGLNEMRLPEAWEIYHDESPVIISTLDTGCRIQHPDLAANTRINPGEDLDHNGVWDASDNNGIDDDGNGFVDDLVGWDFVSHTVDLEYVVPEEDYAPRDNLVYPDINGHGTHVAGTAAAVTNNGIGVAAASWNVRHMPVRIGFAWDDGGQYLRGSGYDDDIAAAIQYASDNGARVISLSFGGDEPDTIVPPVILYARANNTLFFASAGNDDTSSAHYPAAYPGAISVAALEPGGIRVYFSNYGPTVDLAAPGRWIWSTMCNSPYEPYDYVSWGGTSMACPNAASVAALIISYRPCLTDDEVEQILLSSCDSIDAQNPGYEGQLGAGLVNAKAALDSVRVNRILGFFDALDGSCHNVVLTWMLGGTADSIRLFRDGSYLTTVAGSATSYTDVPPAGSYLYSALAYRGCGATPMASDSGLRFDTPTAPDSVAASDDICDSIAVTWVDPPTVGTLAIQRNGMPLGTVAAGVERFVDYPTPGIRYLYSVTPYNGCGVGTAASDSGGQTGTPSDPVFTLATDGLCDMVVVTWNLPDLITGVRIYRGALFLATVAAPTITYTDVSPPVGPWLYTAVPFNGCGTGTGIPDMGYPGVLLPAVGNVQATDTRCDSVIVTWNNVSGESGYRVYRDTTLVAELPNQRLRCADRPAPGTYRYSVIAFNVCGPSPASSDSGRRKDVPPPVQDVSASDDRLDSVIVTWSGPVQGDSIRVMRNGMLAATLPVSRLRFAESPCGDHFYQVMAVNECGISVAAGDSSHCPSAVTLDGREIPTDFFLAQNYPNPFNPSTTIRFGLPFTSEVQVTVYDVMGRHVVELLSGTLPAGAHRITWRCEECPSGMYMVHLQAGDHTFLRKMLLMK
ncbi:S8 family serine peptidase [bacterium]|nr:S8 family serine peptidase [bacterium]MBU1984544.1 S8 family serine peptidase [bacterium]